MKFKITLLSYILFMFIFSINGQESFCRFENNTNQFALVTNGVSVPLLVDSADYWGVLRATNDLQSDLNKVSGASPVILKNAPQNYKKVLIIGTVGKSAFIQKLLKSKKINTSDIVGKHEKFLIQTLSNPLPGIDEALVIAGSDMRGTIYGIYELSEQIGVSPWTYWADVPVQKHQNISIKMEFIPMENLLFVTVVFF